MVTVLLINAFGCQTPASTKSPTAAAVPSTVPPSPSPPASSLPTPVTTPAASIPVTPSPPTAQPATPQPTTTSPPPPPVIPKGTNIGNVAPDFQLPTLDGQTISLKGLRGKPVVVRFGLGNWGDLTYFQQVHDKWSDEGLVILMIDIYGSWSVANDFVTKNNLTVLLDIDSNVTKTIFRLGAIPATFFIDKDGVIRQKLIGGFPNTEAIETELRKIMTLPSQTIRPLSYEVVEKYIKQDTSVSTQPVSLVRITIKNTDTISGQFKVKFTVEAALVTQLLEQTISLAPGQSKMFECPATTLGAWDVIILPELKLH